MVKVCNPEYAKYTKDKSLLNKYQGKKAVLLEHDCTFGFEIGETVMIAGVYQEPNGKLRFEIVNKGGNGDIHGFVDEDDLRFIDDTTNNIEDVNIVKVEFDGFKIEGTKAVVIDTIKQLNDIALATKQSRLTTDRLAIIKQDRGDKNCLYGFTDGMLVKIVDIDTSATQFKYEVKNFVNDALGFASDEDLIFLNDLEVEFE